MSYPRLFRNPQSHGTLILVTPQQLSVEQRFGALLRVWRTANEISQRELAAQMVAIGDNRTWMQTTVTKTEAGGRALRLNEFVDLCRLLGEDPAAALRKLTDGDGFEEWLELINLRIQTARAAERAAATAEHAQEAMDVLRQSSEALRAHEARIGYSHDGGADG